MTLSSNINYSLISGNISQNSIGFSEFFRMSFLKDFAFNTNYTHANETRNGLQRTVKSSRSTLSHQLYESLNTSIIYNTNSNNTTNLFSNNLTSKRLAIRYTKKIPLIKGRISINYNLTDREQESNNISSNVLYYDEIHTLEDGSITLLDNYGVITASIIVTDVSKTNIYEENLDYILFKRDNTVEIQRIIGGKILNNTPISVDYETTENNSFKFNSLEKSFDTNLSLFRNLINLKYSVASRKLKSLEGVVLSGAIQDFDRYKYEIFVRYKIATLGASYEELQSTINPIELYSANLRIGGNINRKLNMDVNVRYNDYPLYFKEGQNNTHMIANANINYSLSRRTKIRINGNYTKQVGSIQNFNLITGQGEIKTSMNQLALSLGVNYYKRSYSVSDSDQNYIGAQIRLTRSF